MRRRRVEGSLRRLTIRGSSKFSLIGVLMSTNCYSAHLVFTMLDEIVSVLFDEL